MTVQKSLESLLGLSKRLKKEKDELEGLVSRATDENARLRTLVEELRAENLALKGNEDSGGFEKPVEESPDFASFAESASPNLKRSFSWMVFSAIVIIVALACLFYRVGYLASKEPTDCEGSSEIQQESVEDNYFSHDIQNIPEDSGNEEYLSLEDAGVEDSDFVGTEQEVESAEAKAADQNLTQVEVVRLPVITVRLEKDPCENKSQPTSVLKKKVFPKPIVKKSASEKSSLIIPPPCPSDRELSLSSGMFITEYDGQSEEDSD